MAGRDVARRLLPALGRATGSLLWLPTSYLLAVSVTGLRPPAQQAPGEAAWQGRLTVLVPAHDEERGIAATLASLSRCIPPDGGMDVVVVADNCSDRTARIASEQGAQVWERTDPARGKGQALRWALDRLLAGPTAPAAVAIVDADTLVDPEFLVLAVDRLAVGAQVVQGVYRAAPPDRDTLVTRLADVAAACQSVLRPRGRARLGAAAKLQGNGMVFTADVLRAVPWDAYGAAEDVGYWFRLLRAGFHPEHEPRAGVQSAMPTQLAAARVQRSRWEAGRVQVAKEHRVPALREAVSRRDLVLGEAVVSELVFPPLAPLAGLIAAAALLAGLGPADARRRGVRSGALQGGVVLGHALTGLRVVGAPWQTYAALAAAPAVVVWKLTVKVSGRRSSGWQRTPRP